MNHFGFVFAGSRLLFGTLMNDQTIKYASLAYMAPKLKKLTPVAVTQFLKDRIEYIFNIDQVHASSPTCCCCRECGPTARLYYQGHTQILHRQRDS